MRLLISATSSDSWVGSQSNKIRSYDSFDACSTTADLAPTARSRMPSQSPAAIDWRDAIQVHPELELWVAHIRTNFQV